MLNRTSYCLLTASSLLVLITACGDLSAPTASEPPSKRSVAAAVPTPSPHMSDEERSRAEIGVDLHEDAYHPTPASQAKRHADVAQQFTAPMQEIAPARAVTGVIGPLPIPTPSDAGERYAETDPNPVKRVSQAPVSTFSIDVDTGAYANVRRFLQAGALPPPAAVRVEEMLNYFRYDYAQGSSPQDPFAIHTELSPTPWNAKTQLLHIGIQGYAPENTADVPVNLVFLIDVSGSMNHPKKLGLLKSSLRLLPRQLKPSDTLAIVTYAGATRVALVATPAREQKKILAALTQLQAGGSTHGAAGIELAYQQAEAQFDPNGVNRVILATDGDFNVGMSDVASLKKRIAEKRASGIALTTLGFGTGNYNDHLMEQLADTGDGQYAYIDTLSEARKVLVDELTATLLTIARDVKVQIEFNPAVVSEYRLIGYRNRLLREEDFSNDRVDAGDVGAGHSVTALYEIALVGSDGQRLNPLRYHRDGAQRGGEGDELAYLQMRYKLPGESASRLRQQIVHPQTERPLSDASDNFRFAAAVAAFGQQLAGSDYLDGFDYAAMLQLARRARGEDVHGERGEFLRLLELAQALDG